MTQPQWENVQLQQNDSNSPFLKWGDLAGQTITVVILDYTPDGGRDFDGNPSPRLEMMIIQPGGYNIQDGRQVPLNAGDKLTWQGSTPARMANGVRQATPARGDLMQFTHEGTYRTDKGAGKDIQIKIARGAGQQYLQAFQAQGPQFTPVAAAPEPPKGSPPF